MIKPKQTATFILNSACNMNCSFCVSNYEEDLSFEEVIAEMLELPESVKKIVFTGGEVLLRKDIFLLLSYCKLKGYKTSISTNAILLQQIPDRKLGIIDELNLPLDSHQAKTHDWLRGKGHHSIVVQQLKRISKLGKTININTVVTRNNYLDIPQLEAFLEKFRIRKWKIFNFKPIGIGKHNEKLRISKKQFDILKSRINNAVFIEDIENTKDSYLFKNKSNKKIFKKRQEPYTLEELINEGQLCHG